MAIIKSIIDTGNTGGGVSYNDLLALHNLQSVSIRKFTIATSGNLQGNTTYRFNNLTGFTPSIVDTNTLTYTTGATGIFKEKFPSTSIGGTNFKNTKRTLTFRLTILRAGSLGANAEIQVNIKRADNSIVPSYVRERITDTNSGGVSLSLDSFVLGDTDAFVVQGYYLEIANINNVDLAYDTIELVMLTKDGK